MGTAITEPYVAHMVAASTPPGSTLFLGNSMPIRDVEMYATSHLDRSLSSPFVGLSKLTASNRGASGIDGVLSTAIGFAAGSSRRVCVVDNHRFSVDYLNICGQLEPNPYRRLLYSKSQCRQVLPLWHVVIGKE